MDEQERDYFQRTIRDLERARWRWQVFAFSLLVGFGLFLLVGIGGLVVIGFTTARQQAARAEAEAARAQAQQSRAKTRARADKAAPDAADQGDAKHKEKQKQ